MTKWDENVQGFMNGPHEISHKLRDRENEPSDARIQSQLGFMQEQLSVAQKMVSELTARLEPILMPEMDEANAVPIDVPRKMASEMSNTIDDLNTQVSRLQNRIGTLLHRIQL